MESVYSNIKAALKISLPTHTYRMWIEPIEFKALDDQRLQVSCPNFFSKKRVQDYYYGAIEREGEKILGKIPRLVFSVAQTGPGQVKKRETQADQQLSLPNFNTKVENGRFIRRDFTFDKFVVDQNNDFAYSATLALASGMDISHNSVYLLSQTGMGKSHLSQAVGNHILSQTPNKRVFYITAEDFTNEMVRSIKNNSIDVFKEKYRSKCDVLLMEDIHFLTGKEKTQNELSLTLDYLLGTEKKIIFSSCYLPAEIPKLNAQLQSRLSSGLITKIKAPGYKTRVKILEHKSQQRGVQLPSDIKAYLASELTENVRQLESGLIGLTAKSTLLGEPINMQLAESVVKNIANTQKSITIDAIKKLVAKEYNITLSDLVSKSRKQSIVKPRQIAIYLSRKYTDHPLQAIGKSFNRYHATALHSIKTVEAEIKEKGRIYKEMSLLTRKLDKGDF